VLVLVSTPPANILHGSAPAIAHKGLELLTDLFVWGRPGIYWTDWKLKGFRTFSEPLIHAASVTSLVPLKPLAGVCGNAALWGLNTVLGVGRCDKESFGAKVP
jgi:hypothetical protein